MLPDREIASLLLLVVDATGLADEGHLADGYVLLLAGRRRAEDLRDAGESWGIELVWRYQGALESYIAFYGVSME